jgi:hypothetical protein
LGKQAQDCASAGFRPICRMLTVASVTRLFREWCSDVRARIEAADDSSMRRRHQRQHIRGTRVGRVGVAGDAAGADWERDRAKRQEVMADNGSDQV